MSISSETRKAGPYTGNGVTVDFPFTFKVFSSSDVQVVQTDLLATDAILALTTDYSVALNADQDASPGGTVTAASALPVGELLTITSALPNLQPVVLNNMGGFYPRIINGALDRLTILVQQLAERVSRTLKYSISSPLGDSALPPPVANTVIGWNSTANGFQNYAPVDNSLVSAALASSLGASLVGFIQAGIGAVRRTLQGKLRESVSVEDFGASASAPPAFNRSAISLAIASGARRILFPDMYAVDATISSTTGDVELYGPGGIDGTGINQTTGINETGPSILSFSGAQRLVTTVTQAIKFGDTNITLASTSGIQPGDTIMITSGGLEALMTGVGELWYQSPFGPVALHDHNVVRKVSGLSIELSWPVAFAFDISSHAVNVEVNAPIERIKISGLSLVSTNTPNVSIANGQGLSGVKFVRCKNIEMSGVRFVNLQGSAAFVSRSFFSRFAGCYIDGLPMSQDYVENVASGYSGITMYRSYTTVINGCESFRARHLQDATYSAKTTVSGCSGSGSHRAPFRTHQGCRDTVWSNNTGDGAGGILHAGWNMIAVGNILTSNTFDAAIGDGMVGGDDPAGADIAKVHASRMASSSVSNNTLFASARADTDAVPDGDFDIGGVGIQMAGTYQTLSIVGNSIDASMHGINVRSWVINSAAVTGNSTRASFGSTPEDVGHGVGVRFEYSANNALRRNINVSNNVCGECYGGGVEFNGNGPSHPPADNVIISGNISSGTSPSVRLYLGYFGDQVRIVNNMQDSGGILAVSSPMNFTTYPEVDNTSSVETLSTGPYSIGMYNGSPNSYMPARVVREGAIAFHSNPAPGGEYSWAATNSGTTGILSGVTAATTAESAVVTFNAVTNLFVGCWVSILGVNARIVSLNTSTRVATLSAPIGSTNASAAVAYRSPNFKTVSSLAA